MWFISLGLRVILLVVLAAIGATCFVAPITAMTGVEALVEGAVGLAVVVVDFVVRKVEMRTRCRTR